MDDRYVIIDKNGIVINVTVWDGIADWSPPEGCTAIKSDEGEIGDTFKDGIFIRPEVVTVEEPSITDQIAAMQAQLAELMAKVQ